MKRSLYALLVTCLLTASGCIGELVGEGTEAIAEADLGEGEMSARLDGKKFQGRIAWAERAESTDSLDFSMLYIIGGDVRGEEDGEAILLIAFFESATVPTAGTLRLTEDCLSNGEPCLSTAYGFSDRNGEVQTSFEASSGMDNASAELRYDIYDRGDRLAVRGTFESVMVSDEDDEVTMRVTDGTFDAPLQE